MDSWGTAQESGSGRVAAIGQENGKSSARHLVTSV